MKYIVEFPLENGGTIKVEADETKPTRGVQDAGRAGDVVQRAKQTFEDALDQIKPGTEVLLQRLASLSEGPDEIEVEFGLKLSAEAGAFIANGKVEANYTVKLKWTQKKTST